MTTAMHAPEITRTRGKAKAEPESPRRGIFWDSNAGQFGTRIGYSVDLTTGQRRRSGVKRLGSNPNAAIVAHANHQNDWDATVAVWPDYQRLIRPGLPEAIRDTADLSKPFWVKPEWIEAAKYSGATNVIHAVTQTVNALDTIKEDARGHKQSQWFDLIPPELRARVLSALAPAAHEVLGVAVDAKSLTVAEAVEEYKSYKKSKVGLQLAGRRGGIKGSSLATIGDDLDRMLKLIETQTDLRTLDHEKLEKIIDAAYRRWGQRTAFNGVRNFKAMLDYCHRTSSIDYRHPDTIDEIFRLQFPETKRKDSYDAATIERLKLLKAACERTVEKGGEQVWAFVVLALTTGMYQCDLSALTYDNLRFDGDQPYLWWQRKKEIHHNQTYGVGMICCPKFGRSFKSNSHRRARPRIRMAVCS